MATIKCVVVGDKGVGKTTFIRSYVAFTKDKTITDLTDQDREEIPETFSNYAVMKLAETEMYFLSLFNTSGQEFKDKTRHLTLHGSGVLLVCFSVVDRESFNNVKERWAPEVLKHCPGIPFLLVGNKTDLGLEPDAGDVIGLAEGKSLAAELGASEYLECSATTQEGVEAVFDRAFDVGRPNAQKDDSQAIMPGSLQNLSPSQAKAKAGKKSNTGDKTRRDEEIAREIPGTIWKEEVEPEEFVEKKEQSKEKEKGKKKKGCTVM